MRNYSIGKLISSLNNLLTLESPHAVSSQWDKVAEVLCKEDLKIHLIQSRSYYLDTELEFIHQKMKTSQFEETCEWRKKEKELLSQKEGEESAMLRYEPSLFEFKDNKITGYLNRKKNEALLWKLIEEYGLAAPAEGF